VRSGAAPFFSAAVEVGTALFTIAFPCTCPVKDFAAFFAAFPLDFFVTDGACEVGVEVVEGADVAGAPGAVGAAVVPVVTGAGAWQDSDSERIGRFIGSDNDASGVPAGTSMVNGIFTPPSSVTVTTHSSAEADGSTTAARPAEMAPAATIAPITLRLLNTVANLLPIQRPAQVVGATSGSAACTVHDRRGSLQRGSI
jgi:hypothetical protein